MFLEELISQNEDYDDGGLEHLDDLGYQPGGMLAKWGWGKSKENMFRSFQFFFWRVAILKCDKGVFYNINNWCSLFTKYSEEKSPPPLKHLTVHKEAPSVDDRVM